MIINIEITQAQYHALMLTQPDPIQRIHSDVIKSANAAIDFLYQSEIDRQRLDPSYVVIPDREAAILAMTPVSSEAGTEIVIEQPSALDRSPDQAASIESSTDDLVIDEIPSDL